MTTNIANKDESLKCVDIGRRALADGDLAKAERMAAKAARLYRSSEVADLERAIASVPPPPARGRDGSAGTQPSNSAPQQQRPRQPGPSQPEPDHPGLRRRHAHGATEPAARQEDAGTPEQRSMVHQILQAKDFYQILSVERSATDDDIKKAYRKLALKLHPDKNKATRAEDAFKAVSKAFSCLSDPDKRAYYDRTGYENSSAAAAAASQQRSAARGGMRQGPAGMYYSEEFDADEIFNMFFGGGMNGQMFRAQFGVPRRQAQAQAQARRRQAAEESSGHNAFLALMQLLPVLLLVLLSLFSGSSTPTYSLTPDSRYPVSVRTKRLDLPFFVASEYEFERQYPVRSSARAKLERQVESDYYDKLHQKCQNEQIQRQRMRYSLRQREEARNMKLHACEELESINRRLGRVY